MPKRPTDSEFGMTVLSYGGGQETTYFLYRLLNEPEFYAKHIKGDLIVVGSDTGNEHDHTYSTVKQVEKFCAEKGVAFFWVTADMGFHPNTWQSLTSNYERNRTIGSARFMQVCTDNLKIKVVDNFVEDYIKKTYKLEGTRKKAYYNFTEKYGKIRLILGFSFEEQKRTSKGEGLDAVWKRNNVKRYYPLINDETTRQDCIDYLEAIGLIVYPSNCMQCFYQSDQEILWLYRNRPDVFNGWVILEKAKLDRYEGAEKNFGVFGKGTLLDKLAKAQEKYGHWTEEQLNEYKYSHGHCIKSKY